MKRLYLNIKKRIVDLWEKATPGDKAWKGAVFAMAISTVVITTAYSWFSLRPSGLIPFFIFLVIAVLASFLGGSLVLFIAQLLRFFPVNFGTMFLGGMILLVNIFNLKFKLDILVPFGILAVSAFFGAGVNVVLLKRMRGYLPLQKGLAVSGLVLGFGGLLAGGYWLLSPAGFNTQNIPPVFPEVGQDMLLSIEDPSLTGGYAVKMLSYGSGKDLHRSEFAAEADLVSGTADGSKLVGGWSQLRRNYWGFGPEELPLNGRVWYPVGEGPFPLVLIVHGNHLAEDYSDPGYAYLGELMASRGFIFVSVDENFLNGSPLADLLYFKGLDQENDARGWLLLEHLKAWQEWNRDPSSPFYGRVDMQNIALMGHSRGGEAAAIAAAFNDLSHYPDYANFEFDYHFEIKSVIAIAPIDGQYFPSQKHTPLQDVNYFVLHGSHDMDLSSFDGINQYERVSFSDDSDFVKSALYIVGANHGQFNSTWGRTDMSFPKTWFYNLRQIMPEEDQQKIASVFISAFLESTLHGEEAYLALFQNPYTGSNWLPETAYFTRFQNARTVLVSTYEEDIDVLTATLPGSMVSERGFSSWREQVVYSNYGNTETSGVFLGWNNCTPDESAEYSISFPAQALSLSRESSLVFSMADTNEFPPDCANGQSDNSSGDLDENLIDLRVELEDINGEKAGLLLSSWLPLSPRVEVQVKKADFLGKSRIEPIFQDYSLSLTRFLAENPQLDIEEIDTVRFIFDQTSSGLLVLDDVGFRIP